MVWVHQPVGIHNAVAVGVRVVAKGDIETVFDLEQVRHGIRAGAIHADLAVVIRRHKSEAGIKSGVHDVQVQAKMLTNRLPHRQRRAAHGVHAQR
ncbi:hypothetical protein HAALTHF_29680n [Vreelandella aquamarina]|nr:hypothetical protein HAALTHF_29680n [Halomonas axialensis]